MWSFLVFGRLSLCFSGWVGLVSGILCGGEEVTLFQGKEARSNFAAPAPVVGSLRNLILSSSIPSSVKFYFLERSYFGPRGP
jgi:hypothetical protein